MYSGWGLDALGAPDPNEKAKFKRLLGLWESNGADFSPDRNLLPLAR